jgi:hypothetical protein
MRPPGRPGLTLTRHAGQSDRVPVPEGQLPRRLLAIGADRSVACGAKGRPKVPRGCRPGRRRSGGRRPTVLPPGRSGEGRGTPVGRLSRGVARHSRPHVGCRQGAGGRAGRSKRISNVGLRRGFRSTSIGSERGGLLCRDHANPSKTIASRRRIRDHSPVGGVATTTWMRRCASSGGMPLPAASDPSGKTEPGSRSPRIA